MPLLLLMGHIDFKTESRALDGKQLKILQAVQDSSQREK